MGDRDDPMRRVLEISQPRRIDSHKGAAWLVCLKALRYPSQTPRAYYAVFLQQDKVIDSRLSVVLDRCESEAYAPFDWASDVNNPVPLR